MTRTILIDYCKILTISILALFILAPALAQDEPFDPESLISLNLKDADAVDVFRLIAEQNDLNILVSKDVKGTLSLRLTDITLQTALDVILEATKSKMEITDNILRILPKDTAMREAEGVPTVTEIFTPVFAKTDRLITVLNSHLSPQGKIQTFSPGATSNPNKRKMMLITEIPSNIDTLRRLIEKLDQPIPQILIEAKMVETSLNNQQLLGVDWSVGARLSGTPFDLDSQYAQGGKISHGTLSMPQFGAVLNLLKTEGNANVLSDIKIVTVDGESANIHVGQNYPVGLTSFAGGAGGVSIGTTGIQQFDSGVRLQVVPTVMGNDMIYLEIQPHVSTISGFSQLGGTGGSQAPITSSRTADTKIIIKSGDTVVIGGLLQEEETSTVKKVPVLGDLPFVGPAFRKKDKTIQKQNLLVFITAHIMEIERQPSPDDRAEKNAGELENFLEIK